VSSPRSSDEETIDPLYADERNYYKVEMWTADEQHIVDLLYAGNNLDKARNIFARLIKDRPRAHLTIRQRTRVLERWPKKSMSTPSSAAGSVVRGTRLSNHPKRIHGRHLDARGENGAIAKLIRRRKDETLRRWAVEPVGNFSQGHPATPGDVQSAGRRCIVTLAALLAKTSQDSRSRVIRWRLAVTVS
jgi:hypothetical protein